MEMRLVKEALALEQPMGAGSSQAVVEGEITLPGGLREEARVLHCGAMTVVDSVEALQDRASVTGKGSAICASLLRLGRRCIFFK